MSIITKTNCRITFLEETTIEEVSNIVALVDAAYEMISCFLGALELRANLTLLFAKAVEIWKYK
jgi:hypothetical protein